MKTINSLTYIMAIGILGVALSCGGGNTGTMGEGNNVTVGNAEGLRTSSDMNISPANMDAQDPVFNANNDTLKKADTIQPVKPAN